MYTQCPECKTVFRLHAAQLKAAKGKVRCGQCAHTFDALENLLQRGTQQPQATPPATGHAPLDSAAVTTTESDTAAAGTEYSEVQLDAFTETEPEQQPATPIPPEPQETASEALTGHTTDELEELLVEIPEPVVETNLEAVPTEQEPAENETSELEQLFAQAESLQDTDEEFATPPSGQESEPYELPDEEQDSELGTALSEQSPEDVEEAPADELETLIAGPEGDTEIEGQAPEEAEQWDEFLEQTIESLQSADEESTTPPSGQESEPFELPDEKEDSALGTALSEQSPEDVEEAPADELETLTAEAEVREQAPEGTEQWDEFSEQHIESLLTPNGEDETGEPEPLSGNELDYDDLELSTATLPEEESGEEHANYTPPPGFDATTDTTTHAAEPAGSAAATSESEDSAATEDLPETASAKMPEAAELPPRLALESPKKGGSIAATVFWFIASLCMVGLAGLQYSYFNRVELSRHAAYRPWLEQLCDIAGCQLPLQRDPKSIELVDHAVQSHPRYQDSLLITATLINNARHPQPFPVVEIVMTDIEQRIVASRRFRPADYLAETNSDTPFMPLNEVHLLLEILDPGESAVGFEFNFL